MTEEQKAEYLRWVEEQKAQFEAEEREKNQKLEQEAYAQWKATEYAQWEAECRRLDDEAAAQASAAYDAEWARYNAEPEQYNADYAQYQKDLAQWEIAYAQWEKEQSEEQGKPSATTSAPGTGTDPKAPDAPDTDAGETETPAAAPELTPEQLAAILRMFGQNASYASQQEAIEAQRRAEQQKETVANTPVPVQFKNLGTEEQAERLDGFLAEHPHGSKWDTTDTYQNYGACTAFAFKALHTVYGEDADYVMSTNVNDIRQYSAVKEFVQGQGYHWYFVTSVNDDGTITVAEGNVNGKVEQGNTFVLDPNTVELVWNPAN